MIMALISSDGHELAGGAIDKASDDQSQTTKVDVSAKEEETLGNNSLAHQSFIRTRFKQSESSVFVYSICIFLRNSVCCISIDLYHLSKVKKSMHDFTIL